MRGLLLGQVSSLTGVVLVVAFSVLFLGLVAAVYRRSIRTELERAAQLPLED